ncbi:MAG: hypothetical protein E7327_04435 [Clostridiales bacterium]|nr:hypothetical protein [Clostridiales bacterium]
MKEWTVWMANKLDEHIMQLERLRLPEYIRYLEDRKRFYRMQLVGGIVRGLGTAIGFTILGAVLVWLLQGLAQRNLPVIGDFLAEIVALVQRRLE